MGICGRKKRRFKAKLFVILSIFFVLFVLVFIYFEMVVNPMVLRIAQAEIDSVATTAISDAIFEVVNDENIDYNDIVNISYDESGAITSITSNMEKMNYLARQLSTKAQILLDNLGDLGVKIALGAFTGLEALAAIGPKVDVKMTPIGSVITTFNSSFDSAGINQTKHSIYVDVNTSVNIVLPTSSKKMTFLTSAIICESIIIGKVPNVYVNGINLT